MTIPKIKYIIIMYLKKDIVGLAYAYMKFLYFQTASMWELSVFI